MRIMHSRYFGSAILVFSIFPNHQKTVQIDQKIIKTNEENLKWYKKCKYCIFTENNDFWHAKHVSACSNAIVSCVQLSTVKTALIIIISAVLTVII